MLRASGGAKGKWFVCYRSCDEGSPVINPANERAKVGVWGQGHRITIELEVPVTMLM